MWYYLLSGKGCYFGYGIPIAKERYQMPPIIMLLLILSKSKKISKLGLMEKPLLFVQPSLLELDLTNQMYVSSSIQAFLSQ